MNILGKSVRAALGVMVMAALGSCAKQGGDAIVGSWLNVQTITQTEPAGSESVSQEIENLPRENYKLGQMKLDISRTAEPGLYVMKVLVYNTEEQAFVAGDKPDSIRMDGRKVIHVMGDGSDAAPSDLMHDLSLSEGAIRWVTRVETDSVVTTSSFVFDKVSQ